MKKIRIALSGGGHRATVFGLGALLYLADCGRNRDVQTITSVSGGSLTNAYLSLLDMPFNEFSAGEFEYFAAQFAKQIAGSPGWWWFSMLSYFLCLSVWWIPIPQTEQIDSIWVRLAAFLILICLWAVLIGPRSGGTLWAWWGTWLYVGLLVTGLIGAYWYWSLPILLGVLILAGLRSVVAGWAFGATVRSDSADANIPLASSPKTNVRHIFCATESHVQRHIFFNRDFVYAALLGLGTPGSLKVRDAVQASANFPPAFPFRVFRAKQFQFLYPSFKNKKPTYLLLTDGGIYDNMATAWYRESNQISFEIGLQQSFDNSRRQLRQTHRDALKKIGITQEMPEAGKDLYPFLKKTAPQYLEEVEQNYRAYTEQYNSTTDIPSLEVLWHYALDLLAPHPMTVQSILDEHKENFDEIVVNASYPPNWIRNSLVAVPLINDLSVFPNITTILYNNDNLHRCREFRHLFLNKVSEGAFISIEEHPAQLATYLANIELPEFGETEEKSAENLKRIVEEVKLFYTNLEYPTDKEVRNEIKTRAREALKYLSPDLLQKVGTLSKQINTRKELQDEGDALLKIIEQVEQNPNSFQELVESDKFSEEFSKEIIEKIKQNPELFVEALRKMLSKTEDELRKLQIDTLMQKMRVNFNELSYSFDFYKIRKHNQGVGTTLNPLGVETTAKLLYQGYFCAMMNLHVLMDGYPLMEPKPTLEDFVALASGKSRPQRPTPVPNSSLAVSLTETGSESSLTDEPDAKASGCENAKAVEMP